MEQIDLEFDPIKIILIVATLRAAIERPGRSVRFT